MPTGYFAGRSTGIMKSFNRRVFLISTLLGGLVTAAICFVVFTNVQLSPTIRNIVEFFGRIILFPGVSLVVNKLQFLWESKFHQLWFFLALVFNCVFYGFLMERINSWGEPKNK